MKNMTEGNNGRAGRNSRRVRCEMDLCDVKAAIDNGCKVTILIRHADIILPKG